MYANTKEKINNILNSRLMLKDILSDAKSITRYDLEDCTFEDIDELNDIFEKLDKLMMLLDEAHYAVNQVQELVDETRAEVREEHHAVSYGQWHAELSSDLEAARRPL